MNKGDIVRLLVAPFCRGRLLDVKGGVARVICQGPEGLVFVGVENLEVRSEH